MKYALVIVDDEDVAGPTYGPSARGAFEALALQMLGPTGSHPRSFGSAMLLPLENGLRGLTSLVDAAATRQLRCRVLFFPEEPTWVTTLP